MIDACDSPCLGSVTFGAPLLMWAALGCLVPIVIHLVYRQRPRHQVFPAMRFLLSSSTAATRAHRLKHLVLLACRVLVILLLVTLLARTTWLPESAATSTAFLLPGHEPVCAAICLDNSASMGYRYQGRTRLQRAIAWATSLVQNPERFPPGSQMFVLDSFLAEGTGSLTADREDVVETLAQVQQGDHGRRIRPLLERAFTGLLAGELDRREVYLFTDMTTHAWQGDPPAIPEHISAVYVLGVGQKEYQNVALDGPVTPRRVLSADRSVRVVVELRTFDMASDPIVELHVDGQTRDRQAVGALAANQHADISLTLPALDRGLHNIEITLEPEDALGADNTRFLSVSVGDPPEILMVAGRANGEIGRLLEAMISPTATAASDQSFAVVRTTVEQFAEARLSDSLAVILADPDPLDARQWADLAEYVRRGGCLVVFPGPNTSLRTYTEDDGLLPAPLESLLPLPDPISTAVADHTHPLLAELADPGTDSINDRMVFQRLSLAATRAGTSELAPFSDGTPAILIRQVGSGQVIQFATSPARSWSQWGSRAAPMIVMIHGLLNSLLSPPADALNLTVDDRAQFPVGTGAETVLERITRSGAQSVQQSDGPLLPTRQVGNYRLRDKTGTTSLYYSVNIPDPELDPSRLDSSALQLCFPNGILAIAESPEKLESVIRKPHQGLEMTIPLGVLLLALLAIETLLANRFYGKLNGRTDK